MKIRRIKNTAEKFRNRIAKIQTDNRGLTLIELIITVAIIAIFSGVVLTFITTGSNTYRSTSSSAKVQMETQELVDRMEDMIIDTNRSLYYANGTGENTGSEIKNDIKQSGDGNSDGNKTFIVCNEYKNNDGNTSQYICDVIDWDKEDATVYYSQREYTASSSSDGAGKDDTETAAFSADEGDAAVFSLDEEDDGEQNVRNARTKVKRSVLATGILDFRADLTRVESDNIVRFQLSTENGKKEIETLHSVSLRNKVKVKKPADSVDDTEPTNVGIRISYAPASMDPGASDRLAYDLSGNGSIDPSTITWSVVSDGQNGSFPGEDHTNSRLTINGNASREDWWKNPKGYKEAFRPRLFFINHCRNITLQGVTCCNSPAWTLHPYFSNNLHFIGLNIQNPADSPNTDGCDPESCRNVEILGVRFSLGDDCIAVKSGKIYMGKTYKTPSENIMIRQCLMENGHGAVTLGSEMAGGILNLTVEDCIFSHTDRGLRIKTRRGRGKDAILSNITFRNLELDHVMTPLVVNAFYFCDPDGKTPYVQSREPYPVDERTPSIKKLVFENMKCTNCHVAAAFFDGLPEQKIEEIVMRNISVSYAAEPKCDVPAMSEGVPKCSRKGIFARNVARLVLDHVTIEGQDGEAYELIGVDRVEDSSKIQK